MEQRLQQLSVTSLKIYNIQWPLFSFITAVKFGRMSKKQREKVEDEVRFHRAQMRAASETAPDSSVFEHQTPSSSDQHHSYNGGSVHTNGYTHTQARARVFFSSSSFCTRSALSSSFTSLWPFKSVDFVEYRLFFFLGICFSLFLEIIND